MIDDDFWLHIDDIERFNETLAPFDLTPTARPKDLEDIRLLHLTGPEGES